MGSSASLNLSFRFPSDFVIRFAASKQHIRPRMPDMANNFNYATDLSLGGIIRGDGGNPDLKPYAATGIDLNFEKYFGSKGYIALQTFYKHMDRYIASGFTEFDYSGYPPPTNLPPVSTDGILFGQVNTKGGYIYGAELAGTLPFDVFSDALAGFGLTGGIGYTKTKVKDFNGEYTAIPGYSKWVGGLDRILREQRLQPSRKHALSVPNISATSRSTAAASIGRSSSPKPSSTLRSDMISRMDRCCMACRSICRVRT